MKILCILKYADLSVLRESYSVDTQENFASPRTKFLNIFRYIDRYEMKFVMFTATYNFDIDKADQDTQMVLLEYKCD